METPEQITSYSADIPRYSSQANRLNHFNPDSWVWWMSPGLLEKVFSRKESGSTLENPSR